MFIVTAKVEAWEEDFPGSRVKWTVGQSREVHDSLVDKFRNNPAAWTVSGGSDSSPMQVTKTVTGGSTFYSGGVNLSEVIIPPSGGDDAPTLRKALSVSGVRVKLLPGTYILGSREGSTEELKHIIAPANHTSLVGCGIGITILRVSDDLPSNSACIRAHDPLNIVLSDFTLDGNKQRPLCVPGSDENEGVNFKGTCVNVKITRVHIHDTGQDCIDFDTMSGSTPLVLSEGCSITDCILENAGGLGIHNGCNGLKVYRTIIRNNCYERFAASVTPYGGVDIDESDQTYEDCLIYDNASRQISIPSLIRGSTKNTTLMNLVVNAPDGTHAVLASANTNNLTIIGGRYSGGGAQHVIQGVGPTNNANISKASIISTSTTHNGINITGNGTKIAENVVEGGFRGIVVQGDYTNIHSNRITGQSNDGVQIAAGNGALISGNNIYGTVAGKSLTMVSGGHLVSGNNIEYGISGFTGNVVRSNIGVVTNGFGSATILSAQSSIVVTHGLKNSGLNGITPTSIRIAARGPESVWVSARTSTTFTISRSGTSGDLIVDWDASGQ